MASLPSSEPARALDTVDLLTPAVCRAARGALGWRQPDLAHHAGGLSDGTIRNFEKEMRRPNRSTLSSILRAFEDHGVTIGQDPVSGRTVLHFPPEDRS